MTRVTARQVAWFRLRRSGLVDRLPTPEATARRLVGVQAQLMPAAQLAFHNRTVDCPAAAVDTARLETRSLVRLWGQRHTVHLYAAGDWPLVHATLLGRSGMLETHLRRAGLLTDFRRLVSRTARRLAGGEQLGHRDIRSPRLEQGQDRFPVSYIVFMQLVRDGVACHGPDEKGEVRFVHRVRWLPDLAWAPPPADQAGAELAQRYLAGYGPAEIRDLAFWHGATQAEAKRWLARAGDALASIAVDGRALWCRTEDLDDLRERPPPPSRWPVRLLNRFDPLLLATRDKTWLVDDAHKRQVWRSSAHVAPVVLAGGRIAGTWRYDRKPRGLEVALRPFGALSKTARRAVETEAAGHAACFGLELAALSWD